MLISSSSSRGANFECCMCGDHGLSSHLFRCKICQFRSQHSYCSNLYPKAETYRVCNWCLIEAAGNNDHKKTTSNSTNLSPCTARSEGDNKGNHGTRQVDALVMKKKSPVGSTSGGLKQKTTTVVAGNCGKGDGMMRMLRRTQSDVAAKRDGMAKTAVVVNRVFRGKVRRYKLLNEVTS